METQHLFLRPWAESDAAALYRYACDPAIGPRCGWPVHTSVEASREVIRQALSAPGTFAVVRKETGLPIGSIGWKAPAAAPAFLRPGEVELGYWIGRPYWGQGLIPEAVRALLALCFADPACPGVWCGYYDGNEASRRVQEKCGFVYHHTEPDKPCPLLGNRHTEHYTYLSRKLWKERMP